MNNVALSTLSNPQHPEFSHEFLDALSLARHVAMAEMIRRDPSLVQIARDNAKRWVESGNYDEPEARSVTEWVPLLDPARLDELLFIMESETENATRMRQSSPLVGIMPKEGYRALRAKLREQWAAYAV